MGKYITEKNYFNITNTRMLNEDAQRIRFDVLDRILIIDNITNYP